MKSIIGVIVMIALFMWLFVCAILALGNRELDSYGYMALEFIRTDCKDSVLQELITEAKKDNVVTDDEYLKIHERYEYLNLQKEKGKFYGKK